MIDTEGIVCSSGPLTKRFEFAMKFAELMDDIFMVMGWGPNLLKSIDGTCCSRQHSNAKMSIFTGLTDTHKLPQPVKASTAYKNRKDFTSEHEYGRYLKSVLKEGMWVKARCEFDDVISVGQKGQFRCSNSRSPPVRVDWEGYGLHWVHWHVLEIIEENHCKISFINVSISIMQLSVFTVGESKQLDQSTSTGMPRKHPYGLNIVGSHGKTMERTDWWELLFYLKKLDSSKLESVLTMLAPYGAKVNDVVTFVEYL